MTAAVTLLSPAKARDEILVEQLLRLVNEAYAVGEAGLWRAGAARTEPGEIAEAVRDGGMLAATIEGRLVGCACVRPVDASTADLGLVSVAPERWGSGIGRGLVHAAEQLASSRGMSTMQLELLVPMEWTHPEKERLRAWYSRHGYRIVRTASFEHVAAHLASQLATPCEFLVFQKPLSELRRGNRNESNRRTRRETG
jgi:GNAT superfamily N-acetyltransferase